LIIEHTDYLSNKRLSLAAKGLLTIIMALPEEKLTKEYIESLSIQGQAWELSSAFTELIGEGYIDNTDVKLF
jgi:hypothetical protein